MFLSLSSKRRISMPSPSITRLCVFLVEFRQDYFVHFFVPSQLTHGDQGSNGVCRNERCQRFRQLSLAAFQLRP